MSLSACNTGNQELLMDVLSFASTDDATRAEAACTTLLCQQ